MTVIFVGDKPSRLNTDPDQAFIGTPSFINLSKWILKLEIPRYYMVNSYTHADLVKICQYWNAGYCNFIALGNNASKQLKSLDIKHFKLPHPSPRNRQLNDPKFIDSELKKCKNYLCV